jgi:hypothetical protein
MTCIAQPTTPDAEAAAALVSEVKTVLRAIQAALANKCKQLDQDTQIALPDVLHERAVCDVAPVNHGLKSACRASATPADSQNRDTLPRRKRVCTCAAW